MKKRTWVLGWLRCWPCRRRCVGAASGSGVAGGAVAQAPRVQAQRAVPVEVAKAAEEAGAGAHRGARHGDADRQRRHQGAPRDRDHRRAFRRRRAGASRATCCSRSTAAPLEAADQAGRRRARGRRGAARQAERDVRALQRAGRQERHHASSRSTTPRPRSTSARAHRRVQQGHARKSQGPARATRTIRAPISGRISAAAVKVGNFVRPGRHRAARHHQSDRADLRHLHGAAAHPAGRAPGAGSRDRHGRGHRARRADGARPDRSP